MKLEWAPTALGQLQEIAEYIARDKPLAAARWADRIFDLAETLVEDPRRGRVVPEVSREDIREILEGRYRLIYRIDPHKISILSVRFGGRRWFTLEAEPGD